MKDEKKGVPIKQFVGLRPKMYAIDDIKKAKGTKKSVVKKQLAISDYLTTLQCGESMSHVNYGFRPM